MYTAILILLLKLISEGTARRVGPSVGTVEITEFPCENSTDVRLKYEIGLSPSEENKYSLYVFVDITKNAYANIKFDSPATVTLSDPSVARVTIFMDKFHVAFFEDSDYLGLTVKGPTTGTIPYLTSLQINNEEFCQYPKVGFLDKYLEGYISSASTSLTVPDDTCGRRKVTQVELITNPLVTKPGDWPWHVAIYKFESNAVKYICGGTLISNTKVITAAHCVTIYGQSLLPEILGVVLGKYNLYGGDTSSEEREIHHVKVHEDFDHKLLHDDIALLVLKTEVKFNSYIQPACLWSTLAEKKLPTPDIYGTVVGWGFDQTRTLSQTLHQAIMPKVTDSACIKSNPVFYGNVLNGKKFCAGFRNGTSACNGDSGGGYMVFVPDISGNPSPNASGTWHLRGIISLAVSQRNQALCDPYQYVIFTDVSKYGTWLSDNI